MSLKSDVEQLYNDGVLKRRYYGCVKTKRQAIRFVELMKECDWDYDKRDEVKQKVIREVR